MIFYITGILLVSTRVQMVASTSTLTLPTSANCGDPAVLTCTSSGCTSSYRFIRNGVLIYNNFGPPSDISDPDKYSATVRSDSQVQLTITNIQYSDVAQYACNCGFNKITTGQTLVYQCKASTSSASVTSDKKLSITVDRLYPEPSSIVTTNTTNTLQGGKMCWPSSTLASHFRCSWDSTTSFPDGIHSYTITVTTVTQAAPVSGLFRIVTPMSPNISNLVTISNNRQVLHGVQDTPLTIQCVSKGGIPAPTLAWYRGNTSTSPLAQSTTSDAVQQPDGKYTVHLTYRFTPSRTDDMTQLLCRVFYPGAASGASPDPSPAAAFLYLDLRPSGPTVSQTGEAVSGGSMTLRCTSVNGRPAPNITWSYRGQTFTPTNTLSYDLATETYTVVSVLQRPVSAEDNGQRVTCSVSHTTLSVPRNGTVVVDVKYPPAVTVSTTFSPSYTVTCKAEGYPDSYTYQDWVQIWPGYGPVAIRPFTGTTLNLTGATYERSGVYVCGASNGIAVYDTNMVFMKGNATVIIKAPPVLTYPSSYGAMAPVAGRHGQDATTEIKYWSNVDDSVVKCYKHVGGSRSSLSSCSVTETNTEVALPVHNHMVKETGTLAIIKIHISSQEDMTAYDVVVSNSVQGESVLGIIIVPQGPPEEPTLLGNYSITPGQVILTVLPGFHGGYKQTLVVQISTDLTTWINNTSVYIGLDNRPTDAILASLSENTLHYVRVFAYNAEGGSNNYSTVMNFTTVKDVSASPPSTALIMASIGTTCALMVVAVLVVVVLKSKKVRLGCFKPRDKSPNIYESTAAANDSAHVYSQLHKPVDISGVQHRSNDINLYERPNALTSPEHVYSVLSVPAKEDMYVNLRV